MVYSNVFLKKYIYHRTVQSGDTGQPGGHRVTYNYNCFHSCIFYFRGLQFLFYFGINIYINLYHFSSRRFWHLVQWQENLHPTYAFPAAAGSAGNYAPGKLVWSSKDKHTVPVDAALTGHTTVVDHHPEANHPQRHEVFVEPSRVAFTTEGTQFKTQRAV